MPAELLDRAAELAALERAVAALAAGRSSLIEIIGGCGTGRSALLDRAVELARGAGAVVLTAHGVRGSGRRLVGQVTAQLAETGTPAEAIAAVLRLASTAPVLLAVDDVDGFDDDSRAWLTRLGERARGTAIAIVVTGTARRVLEGAEVLSTRPLPPAVAGDLLRCTGGLPSVLHAVSDRPGTPEEVAELAAEAYTNVAVRALAALPADAARLLRAIALCGPRFGFELTCAVARPTDLGPAQALRLLEAAGLVTGEPPALVPGLDADRLLAGLTRQARDELHVRAARLAHRGAVDVAEVARILEQTPPLGEPWVVPTLRVAARLAAEPEAAVRCLERALREPADPATAARLVLEIALVESVHAPETGDRRLARMLLEDRPECAPVRLAAADQLLARGDAALARRTFGAMPASGVERDGITAMYWLVDDAPLEVPEFGLLEVAPLPEAPHEPERAGAAAWLCATRGADAALARTLARTALRAPATVLAPRMAASCALAFTGDLDEAFAGLDDVVLVARERGLNAVVSQTLVVRAKLLLGAARLTEARADLDAALTALPLHCWHRDARPLVIAVDAQLSVENGLVGHAEELCAAVPDDELGSGYARTLMMYVRAELALRRGDSGTALALAEECGRRLLARGWRNPVGLPWCSVAARASLARGDTDRAEVLSSYEMRCAREWGVPGALGLAHLSRAAVSGDRADLTEAVRLLRNSPYRLAHATALLGLAEMSGGTSRRALVREAGAIAVRGRAAVLLGRARRLGWVPGT